MLVVVAPLAALCLFLFFLMNHQVRGVPGDRGMMSKDQMTRMMHETMYIYIYLNIIIIILIFIYSLINYYYCWSVLSH